MLHKNFKSITIKRITVLLTFLSIPFIKAFAQEEISLQSYGFFQPVYRIGLSNTASPSNEFFINRFRIGLESKISNFLKSEIELDPLDQALIKDADIRFNIKDRFELTIGKFKMPFSYERLMSVRSIPFLERSRIVKELNDLGYAGRDLGVQLSYSNNFNKVDLKISAGVFNGNPESVTGDNDNYKSFAQRLEISSNKNFQIGINSSQKFDSLTQKYFASGGFDFILILTEHLKFSSEYLIGRRNEFVLTGGFYSLVEYQINNITFGFRFSKYYEDTKTSGINFYETKIDWRQGKIIRIHLNLISEQRFSHFDNNLFIGVSYAH